MWDSMYAAHGCGLAAPQVNIPIRLFVADSISTWQQVRGAERLEQFPDNKGIREVFINPEIIYQSDTTATDLEGCLSIPGKSGQVVRPWQITIRYLDARFREQEKTYAGFTARMIQHEMDHLDGILYIDKM
ncbi:peptide deformylase [Chitinophaga dinghuensis]|uniref:Peptide deformylase n=2 Tax=Chitinophaga dinghuensis TaxID=1539050 RepID=A0A327VY41_9BACT|nr:peptide deformylase [Chitinophaga dinghuensis]